MNERRGSVDAAPIAIAVALSWLTMMSLAFMGALAAEAYLGHHPLSEFAVLFVPVMTVPFAFVLAAVYLPTTLLVQRKVRGGPSWIVAAAGGAAAPLAGLALLAAGRILFSGSPHMRPAMWDDLIALSRDPVHALPYALALLAGGIVFGATIGRARLPDPARFVQR